MIFIPFVGFNQYPANGMRGQICAGRPIGLEHAVYT
jgi:hypothetical protein